MSPDTIARLTLAGYALLAALLMVWRARRCPHGWRLWLLYAMDALYCRLGFHWRSNGPCPFMNAAAGLVVANHRSPLDPILIWVGMSNRRTLEFLTAAEYFGKPVLQFILDAQKCIPVARDGKDMVATRTALRRLREGRLVAVFPEGGINDGAGMRPFDPGVAWLALQAGVPVYPVFIENAPSGKGMVRQFWDFRRVRVNYGPPIDLSEFADRRKTPELLEHVTALLRDRVAALGGLETTDLHASDRPQLIPMERQRPDEPRSAPA